MDDTQRHLLQQAHAVERVVQLVPIPQALDGTMQALTLLLDQAMWADHVASQMRKPLELTARMGGRPVQAGAALGLAENAAQHSMQKYRAELVAQWPVTDWQNALIAISKCAVSEGAWLLAATVAEGLYGAPGSVEWWHAVLYVDCVWYRRNESASGPVVG